MQLLIRMEEIWKTIEGYETYSVSTFGNVRNDKTGKILKGRGCRYLQVALWNNRIVKNLLIHRLVALAFILNYENKECIDHIDGNSFNNNLTNLRWATLYENHHNLKKAINNTTGVKGIHFNKKFKKYEVRLMHKRIDYNLGYYDTIEEATIARQTKAIELFGEFTNSCEKH